MRKKVPIYSKSWQQVTTYSRTLNSIYRQASQYHELEQHLFDYLPAQAKSFCRLASYDDGILTLHCAQAGLSTRLRLQQQTLLQSLRQHASYRDLQEIRFKIRPVHTKTATKLVERQPIPQDVAKNLQSLADENPDSSLARALTRLAKHQ